MKLQVQIPKEEEIVRTAKFAGVLIIGLVVVKTVTAITEKIHEKKQDREIKKLKSQVSDQEARISKLEKA